MISAFIPAYFAPFTPNAHLPGVAIHANLPWDIQDIVSNEKIIQLLAGNQAVLVADLSTLPLYTGSEEWVIAALAGAREASETLIISKECHSAGETLQIKKETAVTVQTSMQQAQLSLLAPHISTVVSSNSIQDILKQIRQGELAAAVIPALSLDKDCLPDDAFISIRLHPNECLTPPGRGALALVCHGEDVHTKRQLKDLHQRHISLATNVERSLLSFFPESERKQISAYCRVDPKGYFHLKAMHAGIGITHSMSLSTSSGLAETMAKVIHQKRM